MTAAQLKSLTAALATAQVEKLPARIGKFLGANPHVVTLTYGDKASVLTLPTGARLPEPLPGGKLDATGRFALVAHELKGLLKSQADGKPGANKPVHKAPSGKAFPAHWDAPPRLQTADYRKLPGGYGFGSSTMAGWIQRNLDADAKDPNRAKPEAGKRPSVSGQFARQHPAGSYAPGELLVGMQKGTALADSKKALQQAIPGLVVVKAMINNTIFHVRLPATTNVEQTMATLKKVKSVRYAELNGIARIQPVPRIPPRKLGRPLIRPRR